jgi:hypothetical protein
MSVPWYPKHTEYFVQNPQPEEWPVRQGDVLAPPEQFGPDSEDPWFACQVVHPSCELVAKSNPKQVQIVRVNPLASLDLKDQESVVRGYQTKEGNDVIAFAHTFFLPPVAYSEAPMFADFRSNRLVPRSAVVSDRRIATLTHEARVYFIRRKIYWEQRWFLDHDDVKRLESRRIASDVAFKGPKPTWAFIS